MPTPPTLSYKRDEHYYISDGNVVIAVENVLFKLHRSRLDAYSPVFREMWSIPTPTSEGGSEEGQSDENPIILHGIKAIDFTRFLWIVYPLDLGVYEAKTVEDWKSILDQAERWQVDSLRTLAAEQLHKLDILPVAKISLWNKYNLDRSMLSESFRDLCVRAESLTEEEAMDLGMAIFIKVAKGRDEVHRFGICNCFGRHPPEDRITGQLTRIVRDVFGIVSEDSSKHLLFSKSIR
ncbi:hypothetical protein C8Q75DRAFT_763698 [Abortiporus biennis]|nr:hypothetical protein C8Q75DRAFT_763698 [Abortiporus biennis]